MSDNTKAVYFGLVEHIARIGAQVMEAALNLIRAQWAADSVVVGSITDRGDLMETIFDEVAEPVLRRLQNVALTVAESLYPGGEIINDDVTIEEALQLQREEFIRWSTHHLENDPEVIAEALSKIAMDSFDDDFPGMYL